MRFIIIANTIFKELQKLDLSMNEISNVNILEKVNLKILNLSNNVIENINILSKLQMNKIKEINFSGNKYQHLMLLKNYQHNQKIKFVL